MFAHAFKALVERTIRRHHQHIVTADQPDRAVGKDRDERGDDGAEIRIADVVGVGPLAEDATGGEAGPRATKNSRVKSAATPAIHGFDGSEMITLYFRSRQQQVRAAVTDNQIRARVRQAS